MGRTTTVRFSELQREKLRRLAEVLATTPHAVVGMLVDNAELQPVERLEAVPKMPGQRNNRSTQTLASERAAVVVG